jgi:hypothetical protein
MGAELLLAEGQTERTKDRHDEAVADIFAIDLWLRLNVMLNFERTATYKTRWTVT